MNRGPNLPDGYSVMKLESTIGPRCFNCGHSPKPPRFELIGPSITSSIQLIGGTKPITSMSAAVALALEVLRSRGVIE